MGYATSMALVTRKDVEQTLWFLGARRWIVHERIGILFLYVPRRFLPKLRTVVNALGIVGVDYSMRALPWWRCWFKRQQWYYEQVH